ncbi:hypothetical protein [Halopseudomonas sp.]|uniref:hypothetical protein n=1 Tax=Halopseudomonas sp. TaxID=2901191 RepID=UPI003001616C
MENLIDSFINYQSRSELELSVRAERMKPTKEYLKLDPKEKSIQFLRGVDSRAGFALAGYYIFIASGSEEMNTTSIEGYPGAVLQSYLNRSSLNNISLACRKVFDHGIKGSLTGAFFAKTKDIVLEQHADYWSKSSGKSFDEALQALRFLRSFFGVCSKSSSNLLLEESPLCKRIGFLKQYADRAASHLSLDSYEVDVVDVFHVVASLTLVAEIIRSFDRSCVESSFYNDLDEASHSSAKAIFPNIIEHRLFENISVERQARLCWSRGEEYGLHVLLRQVPYATGFV